MIITTRANAVRPLGIGRRLGVGLSVYRLGSLRVPPMSNGGSSRYRSPSGSRSQSSTSRDYGRKLELVWPASLLTRVVSTCQRATRAMPAQSSMMTAAGGGAARPLLLCRSHREPAEPVTVPLRVRFHIIRNARIENGI